MTSVSIFFYKDTGTNLKKMVGKPDFHDFEGRLINGFLLLEVLTDKILFISNG